MSIETAWRVFKRSKHGMPMTLFHGFWGQRELKLNTELHAEKRIVTNPGKKGKGKPFISGWHVVRDKKELEAYMKRFKHPEELVPCRVFVRGLRDKPGSDVKLADVMWIVQRDWTNALDSFDRQRGNGATARAERGVGLQRLAGKHGDGRADRGRRAPGIPELKASLRRARRDGAEAAPA